MEPSINPPLLVQREGSRRRIAVIGSGAAGLAAAWSLAKRHDVHLFEADDRLGGHAHTVDLNLDGGQIPVDTGFIVFNEINYPSLTQMFDALGIVTQKSQMSFSVSVENGRFEYSGRWPGGLLAQKRNLISPTYWRMLADIRRFYARAADDLAALERGKTTLDDYIADVGFASVFRDCHLLPMVGAIWSLPTEAAGTMPAAAVVRFFRAHGLLHLRNRPQWRTVTGGSRQYVRRLIDDFGGTLHQARPVKDIVPNGAGVALAVAGEGILNFDAVVIAAHGDQALKLLKSPDESQARVLGAFRYSTNTVVLHSDVRLMPHRRSAWAAWNFIETGGRQGISYWMNCLQALPTGIPILVTLNPPVAPDPCLIHGRYTYEHPIFDQDAIDAQGCLDGIQGKGNVWFCGSYFGYGFHEDAFASGLRTAARLHAGLSGERDQAQQHKGFLYE